MHLTINTDGASRGNPGPAAYAFVLRETDGAILHQEGHVIGESTNNIAEYTAVLKALHYVSDNFGSSRPHDIQIMTDSLLMAQQLSGNFKIKNEKLKELYHQVKQLEKALGSVTYSYVPRAVNFIADRLANIALDNNQ